MNSKLRFDDSGVTAATDQKATDKDEFEVEACDPGAAILKIYFDWLTDVENEDAQLGHYFSLYHLGWGAGGWDFRECTVWFLHDTHYISVDVTALVYSLGILYVRNRVDEVPLLH